MRYGTNEYDRSTTWYGKNWVDYEMTWYRNMYEKEWTLTLKAWEFPISVRLLFL